MSEMVNQVTDAIVRAGYNPATAHDIARIAIEAMREPTLDMLQDGNFAAKKVLRSGVSGMTIEAQTLNQCARENAAWRAMIETALRS